jgi:hypothetical protein
MTRAKKSAERSIPSFSDPVGLMTHSLTIPLTTSRRIRDGRLGTNIGTVAALDDAVAAFSPTERI